MAIPTKVIDKNGKRLYFDSDKVKLRGYGDTWFTATQDDFGIPIFIKENNLMAGQVTFENYFLGTLSAKRNDFEIIGKI